jgi:predicted nucleotidyltransferase
MPNDQALMTPEKSSLAAVTPDLLTEVVRRIVAAVEPNQIILFGSYARGTAHEGSDVDLFVIKPGEFDKFEVQGQIYGLLDDIGPDFDVLVRTPETVKRLAAERGNGFVRQRILEQGKVLYERSKTADTVL